MEVMFKNRTIKHVLRIGKYGIVLLDGNQHIVFHLGMTGKFIFCKNNRNYEKHDHIIFTFNKASIILKYNDVRKFGYFFMISNPINLYNFKT